MTEEFDDEEFPCVICKRIYATAASLKRHITMKHPEPAEIIEIPEIIPEPPKKKKKKKDKTPPPPPEPPKEDVMPEGLSLREQHDWDNLQARKLKDKLIAEEGK